MSGRITFVSLGPGDPELVTLKALHCMQQSKLVFYPLTLSKCGAKLSRSGDILRALSLEEASLCPYLLPMNKNRQLANKAYEELAEQVMVLADQGKNIAITAEGDAGFYSSSQYIKDILTQRGYPSQRISGVPAFIDCASLADIHIVSGEQSLEIIPIITHAQGLLKPLAEGKNIVLMKISQSEAIIKEAITQMPASYQLHYIENRGVASKEFYSQEREEILARPFPYFSILLITQA